VPISHRQSEVWTS